MEGAGTATVLVTDLVGSSALRVAVGSAGVLDAALATATSVGLPTVAGRARELLARSWR